MLMKYPDLITDIMNNDGMTPLDYAVLIPLKQTRNHIIGLLNK